MIELFSWISQFENPTFQANKFALISLIKVNFNEFGSRIH